MANGWNKSGQGFEDWRLSKDRAWRQEQAKRAERDQDQMDRGPYLDQDGYTLIVPSLWYNPTVSAFWKSKGFSFEHGANPRNPDDCAIPTQRWTRDTRRLIQGRRCQTGAWLLRVRELYYEFYPKADASNGAAVVAIEERAAKMTAERAERRRRGHAMRI